MLRSPQSMCSRSNTPGPRMTPASRSSRQGHRRPDPDPARFLSRRGDLTFRCMVALPRAAIESYVSEPNAAQPIALVFGPDAGLVSERVQSILRASVSDLNDPFQLVRLEGDELAADPARLLDEAGTIPLFGGKRAIWVRAGGRDFVRAVEALIAAAPVDCRVVIE